MNTTHPIYIIFKTTFINKCDDIKSVEKLRRCPIVEVDCLERGALICLLDGDRVHVGRVMAMSDSELRVADAFDLNETFFLDLQSDGSNVILDLSSFGDFVSYVDLVSMGMRSSEQLTESQLTKLSALNSIFNHP